MTQTSGNKKTNGEKRSDALLAMARREGRGKLTIFLGAAPGVGKSYAMLSRARKLKADGVDIVVGVVETHGRSETAALLEGLDVLPRRHVNYRGRTLDEFDLDAALKRKPKLIIVDELAHTNAPEGRHPKRYQDVAELIAAGIDVWTAMNIQHLESLSDVVSQITKVRIREIVPDTVLKKADEVIVVDITPGELIQRLNEGRVYLPDNAKRAADAFFKAGNLTALRELALRCTAGRVDDQMIEYLRQNAIEGPWATGERLLVCVGPDSLSEHVVRTASRLASSLNAPWLTVYMEKTESAALTPKQIRRLDETMRLAERLGSETKRIMAQDLPAEILQLARSENITQIIIGRSKTGRFAKILGRSLPDQIMRRATDIGVYTVTGNTQPQPQAASQAKLPTADVMKLLIAPVVAVAAAVLTGTALSSVLALPNLSMLFLTAVLACALRYGRLSAISTAFLSFFAYNFFFIPPIYSFTVAEPYELFALGIFLTVAIVTGGLAGRTRDRAQSMRRRAVAIQSLYEFSRKLSGASKPSEVAETTVAHTFDALGISIIFGLSKEHGDVKVIAAWPPIDGFDAGEATAARWAVDKKEAAGWRTTTLPNTRYQFRPLVTTRGVLGVCGFEPPDKSEPLTSEQEQTLTSILDQAAIALDRALLVEDSVRAASLEENERLRTALLSSISHDLRTPLASIMGAVTTLRELGEKMPRESRQDLLASIEEEAARLSRFVSNLVDMTRIEAGVLDAKRDWVDMGDVVRAGVAHMAKAFPAYPIATQMPSVVPLVRGDGILLEQVLFNILDNARKYGGEGSQGSLIDVRVIDKSLVVSLQDDGPGIPERDLQHVFEKFNRRNNADGAETGTGLGLSICKGLVEAMDGKIYAESPVLLNRGTKIMIKLPIASMPHPLEVWE